LQIVRRTLLELGFPLSKVQEYDEIVRGDHYDLAINTEQERQVLRDLLSASDNIGLTWQRLKPTSPLVGQTLAQANLRARAGASVVAIMRKGQLIPNPHPESILLADDLVGLVGDEKQLSTAQEVIALSADDGADHIQVRGSSKTIEPPIL
jgi:CPA2 family monovalent cation:H+ antiporter-2